MTVTPTTATTAYVLVTPKEVILRESDVVKGAPGTFAVHIRHTLDEYKNEYEVYRKKDVSEEDEK